VAGMCTANKIFQNARCLTAKSAKENAENAKIFSLRFLHETLRCFAVKNPECQGLTAKDAKLKMGITAAKEALDKIMRKGRIHLYKPIQIAEILYHSRRKPADIDIQNLSTYRNASKKWREIVSMQLVGSKSTSSARFQDNIFEDNAMPPKLLAVLDRENREKNDINS